MYKLHEKLAADCMRIGSFTLCEVLLMNDAQYPWCILVPQRADISEIYQLPESDQQLLLRESSFLGATLMQLFKGDKLNIAALGNVVPQLHVHHIVRYQTDPSWPQPVWGRLPARPYPTTELEARLMQLRQALAVTY